MGMIAYWSGKTGNTQRFVDKLGLPSIRIPNHGAAEFLVTPFVLVFPTYADGQGRGAVPRPVLRFMEAQPNRKLLLGIIGGGNRNFGAMFAQGAFEASVRFGAPVLYRFELAGLPQDIQSVAEGLRKLWTTHQSNLAA